MREMFFAPMDCGTLLPVIDLTNPAFAINFDTTELKTRFEQYLREQEQFREMTPETREALGHSLFGRALMQAAGTYLPGLITYRMKLGPESPDADASPIDRAIAASFPAFAARLRLQDMAQLLAHGLAHGLAARQNRPLCLVNIAGGAAADSWNALLLLKQKDSDSLENREIRIVVLDVDQSGLHFGKRAVSALCGPDAPLRGLAIDFEFRSYDWSTTEVLAETLAEARAAASFCGISSEGGLFEYGSDEDIVANLRTLHARTASDAIAVGSVTSEDKQGRAARQRLVATRPRSLESFRALVEAAGWTLDENVERPMSRHVRLAKH